jgi:beta-lactam-binding protein with PASTA domain
VLVALLLGLGAWLLLGNEADGRSETPPTSASASTSASAQAVRFDPSAYIGQDYRQVQAELEGQGLSVTAEPASADQLAAAGRELADKAVAATDPATATTLEPDSPVVLYFADGAYAPDTGGGETTAPETTSEAPETTSEAPEKTSEAPTSTSAAPTSSTAATTSETVSEPASGSSEPTSASTSPTDSPVAEGTGQPPVEPE